MRLHFCANFRTATMKLQYVLIFLIYAVLDVHSQSARRAVYGQYQDNVRYTPQIPQGSALCPEKNGRFPTRTCDGYIECTDGIPEEKLCPDGLLFNAANNHLAFPCQYPIDVDCSGREQTQPAQPTPDCPHQYGYYRMGTEVNCGQFKNCVDGRNYVFNCPEGLAFNDETYRCDWPDQVPTCNAEAYLGFTCPPETKDYISENDYKYFPAANNCQKYYICVKGRPRLYNCEEDKGFNPDINACDAIENVTNCAFEYRN